MPRRMQAMWATVWGAIVAIEGASILLMLMPASRGLADDRPVASTTPTTIELPLLRAAPEFRFHPVERGAIPTDMEFSSDGNLLAVRFDGGAPRVWDLRNGKPVALADGAANGSPVALAPDGTYIAHLVRRQSDRTLIVFEPAKGRVVVELGIHLELYAIAFSPDGSKLVGTDIRMGLTMTPKGRVSIWSLPGGKLQASIEAHEGPIYTAVFSPDGSRLAVGGGNRFQSLGVAGQAKLRLVNPQNGQVTDAADAGLGWVNSIAWAPDGQSLFTASADRVITQWAMAPSLLRTVLPVQGNRVCITQGPTCLLVGDYMKPGVKGWDLARQRQLPGSGPDEARGPVACSPKGGRWASATWDNSIIVWRIGALGREVVLAR